MSKKSSQKAKKKSLKNQAYNLSFKQKIKKAIKGSKKKEAISLIDRAALRGVIHKNKAARMKSAISRKKTLKKNEQGKG